MHKTVQLLAVYLFTAFGSQPLHAAEALPREPLALTTTMQPPLGPSPTAPGFLEQIAREAFRRIGREIVVDIQPGERALINANSGLNDGDLMRTPGFEKGYPNLIQVPEKIGDMDFMAYTHHTEIKGPITWDALASQVVGYASGWKIYERNVKARELTIVRSVEDLFPLLDLKRADLVLADRWQGQYAARKQGSAARLLEPPLTSSPMFIYLNKRHAAIVPAVARALAAMKTDGAYQKIYDATLKPYELQQAK